MNNVNKKYVILFLAAIVLFIIFAVIVFFQQNSTGSSTQSSQTQKAITIQGPGHHSTNTPSVTLVPPSSSPKETTLLFYNYYFSAPTNPLANGAYKNNPYLSDEFKQLLGEVNGDAPVFCPQNKSSNITVGKEEQLYYNGQYMTQEVISRTLPTSKDLYRVVLENVGGKWLIFDVNCID